MGRGLCTTLPRVVGGGIPPESAQLVPLREHRRSLQAWCSHGPPGEEPAPDRAQPSPPPGTPGDSSKERAAQSLRDKRGLHPGLLPAVGRDPDPTPCLCSEEPPLDLTGKVYQLEVMLKQLHTDLQKVRPPGSCLTWHFSGAWGVGRWAARLGLPSPPPSRLF